MSSGWPRYLPRFPAVILIPTVLTAWALFWVRQEEIGFGWVSNFPLRSWGGDFNFHLALAVAWTLAMAVDRLVFPLLRGKRRQERATPPEPS